MIYSKFNENQDDSEETTLVTNSATTSTTAPSATVASDLNLSLSSERINKSTPSNIAVKNDSSTISNQATSLHTPYINRNHLKHLDTTNLERNMQIRHDLVIEEGFRASLSNLSLSEEEIERYWDSVKLEVAELQLPEAMDSPKLRALISEIKEMMIDLYPKCDVVTGEFSEFLEDTHFLIQQIKNGALDIQRFFEFLGNVMKKNCAPKRDVLVDSMMKNPCPIEALKAALKLIELMKLDLANFKLDQLRPLIAKTAISTERAFFSQLFQNGKISLDLTTKWINETKCDVESPNESSTQTNAYDVYLDASIKLLVNPFIKGTNFNVPETFILDKKRLINFHGKFQDLCIVQSLLLIFKQSTTNNHQSPNFRKCFVGNLLKGELLRLLEQSDTQISDISNMMIKCLKDSHIDKIDFEYIHSALNNIISPDNELFLLIEKKLLNRIKLNLSGGKVSKSFSGFTELNVLEEFDELIKKFGTLLQYNWNVFEPIYQKLIIM